MAGEPTLRVVVSGPTGVVGRRVVDRLADRGHVVVGLTDDPSGDELVAERGGVPRRADRFDHDDLVWAVGNADVVVNVAGLAPPWTDPGTDRERAARVRAEGAKRLTMAAAEAGARRYVQASTVRVRDRTDRGPFRRTHGGPVHRTDGGSVGQDARTRRGSPSDPVRAAAVAERRARAAASDFRMESAVLRCGFVYGPDAPSTRRVGRGLLARRIPVVGGGPFGRRDADLSVVHADDAARAFVAATAARRSGTWHVVDDRPTSVATLLRAFAERLGGSTPRRVPSWLARLFLPSDAVRLATTGADASNDEVREALGWRLRYPTFSDGLDQVVEAWLDDGTLVPSDDADGYDWAGGVSPTRE